MAVEDLGDAGDWRAFPVDHDPFADVPDSSASQDRNRDLGYQRFSGHVAAGPSGFGRLDQMVRESAAPDAPEAQPPEKQYYGGQYGAALEHGFQNLAGGIGGAIGGATDLVGQGVGRVAGAVGVPDPEGLGRAVTQMLDSPVHGPTPSSAAHGMAAAHGLGGLSEYAPAMLLGPLARTADQGKLAKAQTMWARGALPQEIYDDTKWLKTPKDQWQFEAPDTAARYVEDKKARILGDVLHLPETYAAYPGLQYIPLSYMPKGKEGGLRGSFTASRQAPGSMQFPPGEMELKQGLGSPSVPLHEVQHGVQSIERFPMGGMPKRPYETNANFDMWEQFRRNNLDKLVLNPPKNPVEWGKYMGIEDPTAAEFEYDEFKRAHDLGVKTNSLLPKVISYAERKANHDYYLSHYGEAEARNVQHRWEEAQKLGGYDKLPHPYKTLDTTYVSFPPYAGGGRVGFADGGVLTDDNTVWPEDQPEQRPSNVPPPQGFQWSPMSAPGLVGGLYNMAKSGLGLTGDVASGKARMEDPETQRRVNDMAGLVTLGAGAMPAEAGALSMGARNLSPLGFYSHGADVAANLPQKVGTTQQMRAALDKAGVKPVEMEGVGLGAEAMPYGWKNPPVNPSVSSEELAGRFRQASPQLQETVLANKGSGNSARRYLYVDPETGAPSRAEGATRIDNPAWAPWRPPPQFEQHSLPGGQNYREVLMHLPANQISDADALAEAQRFSNRIGEDWNRVAPADQARYIQTARESLAERGGSPSNFKSSHWDQPNVVAHLRLNDRTGVADLNDIRSRAASALGARPQDLGSGAAAAAVQKGAITPEEAASLSNASGWINGFKGKPGIEPRLLHMEELQSDWGQKGRDEGFADPKVIQAHEDYVADMRRRMAEGMTQDGIASGVDPVRSGQLAKSTAEKMEPWQLAKYLGEDQTLRDVYAKRVAEEKKIPPGPYVTNTNSWTDLGLKRALIEAARGDYTHLSWTPGADQAARYDLSKQIDELHYTPAMSGGLLRGKKDGQWVVTQKGVSPDDLAGAVGKEVADKLLAAPLNHERFEAGPTHELKGQDLQVGGEGMKGFYDRQVPNQLAKLAKKLDPNAKIGTSQINAPVRRDNPMGTKTVPSLEITPLMHERILQGLPQYQRGGRVGFADGGSTAAVPEHPDTLRLQHEALVSGRKELVFYPGGEGFNRNNFAGVGSNLGVVQFPNKDTAVFRKDGPNRLTPKGVKAAIRAGRLHHLLGYPVSREEAVARTQPPFNEQGLGIVERAPDGTEARAAAATDATAATQAAAMERSKLSPENTISAESPEKVLAGRAGFADGGALEPVEGNPFEDMSATLSARPAPLHDRTMRPTDVARAKGFPEPRSPMHERIAAASRDDLEDPSITAHGGYGTPMNSADILAGRAGPVQEMRPYEDPTFSGQLGAAMEHGAERLGAPMSVVRSAGDIGQTVGEFTGLDMPHHAEQAVLAAKHGDYGAAAGEALGAFPMLPAAGAARLPVRGKITTAIREAASKGNDARVTALQTIHDAQQTRLNEDIERLNQLTPVPVAPRRSPGGSQNPGTAIRDKPYDEALSLADTDHHLIRDTGANPSSYYVGGPTTVKKPADLTALRRQNYGYLAGRPDGWDWYDRYRATLGELHGDTPPPGNAVPAGTWSASMEGQWSAQHPPATEFGMAQKERSGAIAGIPQRANTDVQHEAFNRAIATGDPNEMQLGNKTGQYAQLIEASRGSLPPQATGVNDFRHATQLGYREPDGSPWDRALGEAQHRFVDNETAKMVKWANDNRIAGKTDWTGEQVQAAIWTRQKAEQEMVDRPNLVEERIRQGMSPEEAYEHAFNNEAWPAGNATIAEHLPGFTTYTTHEAQPGLEIAKTGHLPKAAQMTDEERQQFKDNPLSSWLSPKGHDRVYSGLGVAGTPQVSMMTRPASPSLGKFPTDAGVEYNPSTTGRVITGHGARESEEKGAKAVAAYNPADEAILTAGETLRGAIDAQNASAAHRIFKGGSPKEMNALDIPLRGATREQLAQLENIGSKYGLHDAIDRGQNGVTLTSFRDQPPDLAGRSYRALLNDLQAGGFDASKIERGKIASIYADLEKQWAAGPGSGQVTQLILDKLSTPEMREAFAQNPHLAEIARNRILRDDEAAKQWGGQRLDLRNLRAIIAMGKDWPDRLEQARKYGLKALVPTAAAAGIALYPEAGLPAGLGNDANTSDQTPSARPMAGAGRARRDQLQ